MNRLTNIFNRASVARSDSGAASPAGDATTPAQLVRSKGARNLNLPAPIGKREQAKRLLGAAFSVSKAPTALGSPVNHQAKNSRLEKTSAQQHVAPSTPSPLADRFKALREPPTNTPSNISSHHSEDPSFDEMIALNEHKQYYNLK